MRLLVSLILLSSLLAVIAADTSIPFGPELPAKEAEINLVRGVAKPLIERLNEKRRNLPPLTYIGVSTYRLQPLPDGVNSYLLRLQINHVQEFWAARILQRKSGPLELQDLVGPIRASDPLPGVH